MRHHVNISTLATLALVALAGCSAPSASDAGGCPTSYCNSHGVCGEANYLPVCTCEPGYEGLTCLTCSAGFHRIGSGTCVADESCAADFCGPHGTCNVTGGIAQCACAAGYTGPRCDQCYGAFIDVSDAGLPDGGRSAPADCVLPPTCTAGSCGPGYDCDDSTGVISCVCTSGSCTAIDCTNNPCGTHGTCDVSTGAVRCTCEAGYQGSTCSACATGFHADGALDAGLSCSLDQRCTATSCGPGSCSLVGGLALCTCDSSTTGESCEFCAAGYHRVATGACEPDQRCSPTSCPARASCVESGGLVTCPCLPGYAGAGCAQCAPGFHVVTAGDGGTSCELDQRCGPTTCGGGLCEDGTGRVVCRNCPTGFSGTYCEVNVDDCGTACLGGRCIDLVGSRICLCTDNTWGQSCQPGPTVTQVSPTSGPRAGGTTVTLTGTGFVTGTIVTVNGVNAITNVLSATSLTFVTPVGLSYGPATVLVRGLNGQTASTTFTYAPLAFTFSGGIQRYTVPAGISSLTVHAWGAAGGAGADAGIRGGAGGHAVGTLAVDAGQVFIIVVGEGGQRWFALDGGSWAAGAGGGLSGLFSNTPDGGFTQGTALLIAGGGGGGGLYGTPTFGSSGGNGGGVIGGAGAVAGAPSLDARGLGGSATAGGIGGCSTGPSMAQCGQNGAALSGGGGGVNALGVSRVGATFGGGGGAGPGTQYFSGGGGGGWWGGGGGANETAQGGGGGSGMVAALVSNGALDRGTEPGVPAAQSVVGYRPGAGVGGNVDAGSTGGHGLVLLFP